MSDLETVAGQNGLPKVNLIARDGARAEIYLHGGQITSWVPAGGAEQLFLSQASEFRPGAAIRGGIPVIFPQFAGFGPLPKHGFARLLPWQPHSLQVGPQSVTARLELQNSETSRQIWPYPFSTELAVVVGGTRLEITLAVTNLGAKPFRFTTALHTYLKVADILEASVLGLGGRSYRDTAAGGVEAEQEQPALTFAGEVDRIYWNPRATVRLNSAGSTTYVKSLGFSDIVIWNPGPEKGAALADLEPDGYRRFVCVESAVIGAPIRLSEGETWQGTQTLSAGAALKGD